MAKGNSIAASMIYKTLERFSVMAFQMIVQIVIARILSPADYGIVAMWHCENDKGTGKREEKRDERRSEIP